MLSYSEIVRLWLEGVDIRCQELILRLQASKPGRWRKRKNGWDGCIHFQKFVTTRNIHSRLACASSNDPRSLLRRDWHAKVISDRTTNTKS